MRYLLLLLILSSCSAEWHLRKAIKKNPEYSKTKEILVPYRKDTTIYVNIFIKGDSSTQESKLIIDSLNKIYNDSFTTVYQLVDSLGKVKTSVVRKPYAIHDTILVSVTDTFIVEVPATAIAKDKIPNYIWVLVLFTIIIFLLTLHKFFK